MKHFDDPPSAFDYVVDSLQEKSCGYIINIVGPAEEITNHAATIQVVDENRIYQNNKYGFVGYLPFDPESATHESHRLFQQFQPETPFDDVSYDGIPCYAMKFGADMKCLLNTVAKLLNEVFEYPELTCFKCTVYEDPEE